MATGSKMLGVTGRLKVELAFPTASGDTWRIKPGAVVFKNGMTVDVEAEEETIPRVEGENGITATYYVLESARLDGEGQLVGDVTKMTCRDGKLVEVEDVALNAKLVR